MTPPSAPLAKAAAVYLGDEVHATGYRLAGLRVVVPEAGREGPALAAALASADLVLLSADLAAVIPESMLQRAQSASAPLLVVVPGVRKALPDVAQRIRSRLGLES